MHHGEFQWTTWRGQNYDSLSYRALKLIASATTIAQTPRRTRSFSAMRMSARVKMMRPVKRFVIYPEFLSARAHADRLHRESSVDANAHFLLVLARRSIEISTR